MIMKTRKTERNRCYFNAEPGQANGQLFIVCDEDSIYKLKVRNSIATFCRKGVLHNDN